ncbi:MAG: hypothetical protein OXI84_08955 [bacterium]|nr:hypothetical protein [bacterium]
MNDPAGTVAPKWSPQHVTVPSVRTPQPTDTAVNNPAGVNDPDGHFSLGAPQQLIVLSVRSPHDRKLPAKTWVNDPEGAFACPRKLSPQHLMVPSLRNPHE